MDKKFTDEQLNEQVTVYSKKAERLLEDTDKLERFLQRLEEKLKEIPVLGEQLANLPILASLVKSYVKKEYREIPTGSIVAILGVLIYFVTPLDLIPDAIPIVGFADEAALLLFVWKMVSSDVEDYMQWQKQNGKR